MEQEHQKIPQPKKKTNEQTNIQRMSNNFLSQTTKNFISLKLFEFDAHESTNKKIGVAIINMKDLQELDQSNQELEKLLLSKTQDLDFTNDNNQHQDEEEDIDEVSSISSERSDNSSTFDADRVFEEQEHKHSLFGSKLSINVEDDTKGDTINLYKATSTPDAQEHEGTMSPIMLSKEPKLYQEEESDLQCKDILEKLEGIEKNDTTSKYHKSSHFQGKRMKRSKYMKSSAIGSASVMNPMEISININISGLEENKTIKISKNLSSVSKIEGSRTKVMKSDSEDDEISNSQSEEEDEQIEKKMMKISEHEQPKPAAKAEKKQNLEDQARIQKECLDNPRKSSTQTVIAPFSSGIRNTETISDLMGRIMHRNSNLLEKLEKLRNISEKRKQAINLEFVAIENSVHA